MSQWAVENHGVEPDTTVDDSPADWISGHDVQLEAAIRYILDELEKNPESLPAPLPALPAYPPVPGATEETRTRCGKCRNKRSGRT